MDVTENDKAFVTLATNDTYATGALVLGNSLRRVGTRYRLCILITPDVSETVRRKLKCVFDEVRQVDLYESHDAANLTLMERPELGKTFTKLHIWKLVHYKKCVFLDADTMVLKNCDELFNHNELSAVPDVGWPDCFNSGVFVFVPCYDTFQKLVSLAETEGSFDGGDQGLLNTYFNDWRTKTIENHLSFIYNMVASSTYSYPPAYKQYGKNVKIVHFLGSLKPWLHDHYDDQGYYSPCEGCSHNGENFSLWWEIYHKYVKDINPDELEELCKDIVKLGIQYVPVQQQQQQPDNNSGSSTSCSRRHLWEQGQVDYLGRDSFDFVKKKLDETINGSKKK